MRSQANILEFDGAAKTSRRIRFTGTKSTRLATTASRNLAVIISFSNNPDLSRAFSLNSARVIDLNNGPEDAA